MEISKAEITAAAAGSIPAAASGAHPLELRGAEIMSKPYEFDMAVGKIRDMILRGGKRPA